MINEKETWMGPRGFDEAKYYQDEKSDIGITHSDSRIKAEILEALKRNPLTKPEVLNVYVQDGIVEIGGKVREESMKSEILKTVSMLTGVKEVKESITLLPH
jgi:osmotically-inducible protein OsmY